MQYLCELRVDFKALQHNLQHIRKIIPAKTGIMAVLKADGYGHGAVEVAKYLNTHGVNCFAVAQAKEGQHLREAGIMGQIVVFQPDYQLDQDIYRRYSLECCVSSIRDIECWRDGDPVPCHLFADTGMSREGALPDEARTCMTLLANHATLHWVGFATHLATADHEDPGFAHQQLALFQDLIAEIPTTCRDQIAIHAACSGAIVNLPESHFDLVRPGILLFGLYTGAGAVDQIPVMSVYGRVHLVKTVPEGSYVGYGRAYRTPSATKLAMIAMGYADGIALQSGRRDRVWIRNRAYPVVGKVSMDQIVVDLGLDSSIQAGEEVCILGTDAQTVIIQDAASRNTHTYERCCQLGMRLPRVYLT